MSEEWQPIETAPIWAEVIIYDPTAFKTRSSHKVRTAVQVSLGKWALGSTIGAKVNPTLWQPLPSPPTT